MSRNRNFRINSIYRSDLLGLVFFDENFHTNRECQEDFAQVLGQITQVDGHQEDDSNCDPNSPDVVAILSKKHTRMKKFELMYKLINKSKNKKCEGENGCGALQPTTISKDGIFKIVMEWKDTKDKETKVENDNKKQSFGAEDVLRILKRISDADMDMLGFHKKFNRPEYMICTVLPVPPPAVRPSVRNDIGQRMEDDLTHKLRDIVKANNALKQKIAKGMPREQLDMYFVIILQYHVATLVDNQVPGISPSVQRTGRPLRSMFERLKSKEGRIRGNLMGKRVDFSARTVITPDPCISIDEIGVPIKIAMNLTFPEIVNKYNIDELTQYVHNGAKYPGAKYIRKQNPQRTIRLKGLDTSEMTLEIGDTVDRHMKNGDYVLFNRQPSLHKMSMQGHRVRVMPYDTFRLNACVCSSFNADESRRQ